MEIQSSTRNRHLAEAAQRRAELAMAGLVDQIAADTVTFDVLTYPSDELPKDLGLVADALRLRFDFRIGFVQRHRFSSSRAPLTEMNIEKARETIASTTIGHQLLAGSLPATTGTMSAAALVRTQTQVHLNPSGRKLFGWSVPAEAAFLPDREVVAVVENIIRQDPLVSRFLGLNGLIVEIFDLADNSNNQDAVQTGLDMISTAAGLTKTIFNFGPIKDSSPVFGTVSTVAASIRGVTKAADAVYEYLLEPTDPGAEKVMDSLADAAVANFGSDETKDGWAQQKAVKRWTAVAIPKPQ